MAENGKEEKKTRTILLSGDVNEKMTRKAIEKLTEMVLQDATKDITILIDTYGGYVDSMFGIHDMIKSIPCDVRTVGIGKVMSAGVLILAAGTKGKRFVTPNTTVMQHQVSSFECGTTEDLEIATREVRRLQDLGNTLLAKYTGKTKKQVDKDFKKEKYMPAKEAVKYGLADSILKEGKLFHG